MGMSFFFYKSVNLHRVLDVSRVNFVVNNINWDESSERSEHVNIKVSFLGYLSIKWTSVLLFSKFIVLVM